MLKKRYGKLLITLKSFLNDNFTLIIIEEIKFRNSSHSYHLDYHVPVGFKHIFGIEYLSCLII